MSASTGTNARPEWTPRAEMRVLNTDLPRVDGPDKVTGRAVYPHDVRLPNMVYARLLVVPISRAKIKSIDVSPALGVAGVVHAVRVDEDKTEVRYQGDDAALAVVAATSPEAAEDGLRAVVIELEEQYPPVVTREQALADDAPGVGRRDANTSGERSGGNAERSEAEAAVAAAPFRVEATYVLAVQHHVCLETHGTVVDLRGDSATVYPSTQMVTQNEREFAGLLGISADNVRVLCPVMGGGFGSKFGAGLEGRVACEVAKALGRPVHLLLTRPQEFLMAGNRSGSHVVMRGGADAEGNLVALVSDIDRLGGQGGGSFPSPPYIYDVGQHAYASRSVHTATDSSRAMRAPGHPQGSFCMESIVDELAYAGGFDPLEFRIKNLSDPVYHRQLRRVAAEIGWDAHPHHTKPGPNDGRVQEGVGFAVTQWGSGGRPGCQVEIRIASDGSISSACGSQDLGTGLRTYMAAIPAEEFGLRLGEVTARIGDSALPPSVASGGSVTTGSLAPAIKDAAHKAREAFEAVLEKTIGAPVGGYTWRDGMVWSTEEADQRLSWHEACALLGAEPLTALGEFQAHLHEGGIHGAQAVRVSVDTLTGEIKVLKMVQIQDVGIPLNRLALRSQMNGGMIQALSYALFEERIHDPDLGLMLTSNLEDYKIAGTLEMPELVAIIDDDDTRQTVCGMAEASSIPGHGAIANAVFNACGVRLRSLPMTPDKVLTALGRS